MYKLINLDNMVIFQSNSRAACVDYVMVNNLPKREHKIISPEGITKKLNCEELRRSFIRINKKICIKCGDTNNLSYHHRNPKEKLFNIAGEGREKTLKQLEAEIAKCDVLCISCHKQEHQLSRR